MAGPKLLEDDGSNGKKRKGQHANAMTEDRKERKKKLERSHLFNVSSENPAKWEGLEAGQSLKLAKEMVEKQGTQKKRKPKKRKSGEAQAPVFAGNSTDPNNLTSSYTDPNDVAIKQGSILDNCSERMESKKRVVQCDEDADAKRLRVGEERVWQYVCKRQVMVKTHDNWQISREEKTVLRHVPICGRIMAVTVTREASKADEWIARQTGNHFGLDVEWRPNRNKRTHNKVALLQLSSETECLVVQMLFLDAVPEALAALLLDPGRKLGGVGVTGDAKKLLQDYKLQCNGLIELTKLAVSQLKRDDLGNAGLKTLARTIIGYDMKKPKHVTLSNWAKPVLNKVQVEYASLDAWVSYQIMCKLLSLE